MRHILFANSYKFSKFGMSVYDRRDEGTTTVTRVSAEEQTETNPAYNLRLYPRVHVRFDDSVIDNEHLGRKKSKSMLVFRATL